MAEPVGDLVVDLSLDAARFDEQMARVRRHFSGTETDAKKTAAVVEQSLSRQALAAQKAGISVGQYKAAMRMLPAQFTDVATQLAGGQSPWLILLQQGGQVKDSFGGMIPMFRGLAGAITLPMVGATSLAVATGEAFDEADKKWQWYQSRSHRRGKTSAFLANLRGAWEDRANAQLGLSAATLQADLEKAREMAAKDWAESEASRLKYTEEAQKAYERLQTPLEKYTARQEELNKALKDGKILQADYNTLMAAAKKDYEATLKKPKQSGVKVSAGDRQEDSAHAALLMLQTELRTLEKHAGANEKISQQRRDLWKAESQFAVLEEAAQRRQLSAQEKSLLAHKDETLEYKRQLAALGDKVTYQERLNALAQQADKFAQQQRAKRAAIDAKSRGLTDRQAEREATEQRLKEQYGDNPLALNNVMSEQKKTWAAEDQLRGSWMAGLKSGWSEWEESATDSMSQVKSAATQTFDGIAQNMAAMLTGSEQNWRSFTRSVLSMMTEILLKQAMVGIVGSIGSAIGGAASGGASASGGTAIQAAAAKFHFATGGFTGTGGKYEPAGIVHRGEFVFTKEATSRIGVGNLYRLMRGYAEGGYVGGAGSPAQMRRAEGINFNQNNHVVIQNDGTNGLPGPQMMKAVYDMARKGARDEIQTQMRDGGLFSGGGR
ncbi:phage tail tape measure protein [Escherichia coli]|uniref:phage tail tape measure protein n=1 Tax=Escherichia coli TaxID=562 RepID=UPI000944C9FB|nr:phage tail tape measure protein [Escherichia coli]OKU39238.1 phage tail tape measure protein [Escherichia coli]